MIRGITGIGQGNGPYISIHDGFLGLEVWADFLNGADRLTLDTHTYFAFDGGSNLSPIDTGTGPNAGGVWPQQACSRWASTMNARFDYFLHFENEFGLHSSYTFSRIAFGTTIAGEFSNGINDCGLFIRGVGTPASYTGNCAEWQDASQWTAGTKAGLLNVALASMDSLRDYFFWTWKVCIYIYKKPKDLDNNPSLGWQFNVRNRRISSMVLPTWPPRRMDPH